LKLIKDITTEETQFLTASDDPLKHKVIFVGGFLNRKYDTNPAEKDDDDAQGPCVSSEFTNQLNRGGLSLTKLSTVFFVHSVVHILSKRSPPKSGCRQYLARFLSSVTDVTLSSNTMACRTIANVLLKAHVLHNSDREQELGCLRHKEQLQ